MDGLAFIFKELTVVPTRRDQHLCMELLAAGKINPVIDRAFPLASAAEAHAYLES